MKYFTIILLQIGLLGTMQAQSFKNPDNMLGVKYSGGWIADDDPIYGGSFGLELEYNRKLSSEKHYLSLGVGAYLSTLSSERNVDSLLQYYDVLYPKDQHRLISVPIHYIYKPTHWFFLRTGINNKFIVDSYTVEAAVVNGLNFYENNGERTKTFLLDYYLGTGLEWTIKRVKLRFELYGNYSLNSSYLNLGVSWVCFYAF